MTEKFYLLTAIRREDLDEYGHVNYRQLPKIYEKAQDAFMEDRNVSLRSLETDYGLRSFVRRMEIDYMQQLFEGDDIIIDTYLEVGNTSIVYNQHIEKNTGLTDPAQIASTMRLVVVMVDAEGEKASIPDEVRKKLQATLEERMQFGQADIKAADAVRNHWERRASISNIDEENLPDRWYRGE